MYHFVVYSLIGAWLLLIAMQFLVEPGFALFGVK